MSAQDSLRGRQIAVYARYSSDNQKDTSNEDQIRLCTEHVQRNGGEVRAEFVLQDHAISGAVKNRPGFERLQKLVQRGEINVVVCESADRLSRDLGDADQLWKLISFHNVRLICVSDEPDHRPHLAIIDAALWEAVRVRREAVRENYSGRGVGAPGHRTRHPFSGILFCGVCGHRMVDGGGSSSRAYRCGAASTGGACANKSRLREDVLLEAAIKELKRVLFESNLREKLTEKIRARIATYKVKSDDERRRLERELARTQGELRRLVAFVRTVDPMTNPGAFETLGRSLEEATVEEKSIRAKLDALAASEVEPRLPTEEEILSYVLDVESRLRNDPTTAREQIHRVLLNGQLVMTPHSDGSWSADSALIVGRLASKTTKPRSGKPAEASRLSTSEVVENGSCAGLIHPLYTALRLPVEVRVAA